MFRGRMDAPHTPATPPNPDTPRAGLLSRRTLLRLAAGGAGVGLAAEFARVVLGSNEHTVIPGKVYRTAQLSEQKLARVIAEKGIRTVVNLRGCCWDADWYLGDARAAHAAGISQEDITLSARRFPAPGEVARLVEVLDRTDYPIVLHCNRGADRSGLAGTIARLLLTGDDLGAARRQMWPRYGHVKAFGRTGVLDEFFDAYAAALAAGGEPHTPARFRRWVAEEYCPGPFRAALSVVAPDPLSAPAGKGFAVTVRAENRSVRPWRFTPGGRGGVYLRCWLSDPGGAVVHRTRAGLFARTVDPGESVDLVAGFPPQRTTGAHTLGGDLVDSLPIEFLDSTFAQHGSEPLTARLTVE